MSESPKLVRDAASAPFFDGCDTGTLMLQRCGSCGTWSWPVVAVCPSCGSPDLSWQPSSGHGTIYSFAIVHRAFSPAFADRVPYPVVIVDLDEGVRITTGVPGSEVDRVRIGARVQARFERVDGIAYPVFSTGDSALNP